MTFEVGNKLASLLRTITFMHTSLDLNIEPSLELISLDFGSEYRYHIQGREQSIKIEQIHRVSTYKVNRLA